MKKPSLFEGKKLVILAPGKSYEGFRLEKEENTLVCVVGNWGRWQRTFGKMSDSDPDLLYIPPSELQRMQWYPMDLSKLPPIRRMEDYHFHFYPWCDYLGCNINTGMAAIMDAYFGNPLSISLHGFTFYQSEKMYFQGYASKFHTRLIEATKGNISGHNQEIQLRFFIEHILPHVQVDEALQKVCDRFRLS